MTSISDLQKIENDTVSFKFNPIGGSLQDFTFSMPDGEKLRPLHSAPWVGSGEELPNHLAPVERNLSGDFFCAPFSANKNGPVHGPTANGYWKPIENQTEIGSPAQSKHFSFALDTRIQGADVTKSLSLHDHHPFLYQSHVFTGGAGHFPISHHAMIKVAGGARLSFSPKQFGVTPQNPLENDPERGFSMLAYPQKLENLGAVQCNDGEIIDARTYPFADDHEDMIIMPEQTGRKLGWSAALAQQDGFLFFAIKDALTLPETMLWMSNGGRKYAPWSGRHRHVIGIEEASTSCHANGHFTSSMERSRYGLAQGLVLGDNKKTAINYGFGATKAPAHWQEVANIEIKRETLALVDISGDQITLPFYGQHFGL